MPAGFEVWDSVGNLRVGVTHRLMRFLGYVVVGVGSGSLVNDGLLTGRPFYVANMYSNNGSSYYPGEGLYPPAVWFSGNQMFWTVNNGQPTQIIQFGTY